MLPTPLNVLYVEDNPDDANLMAIELRQAGFAPLGKRVASQEEFLAHLDPKPDLILSDFTMPGFNGLEAFRLMKERKIDLPFIFVSGTIGEDMAVAAMREGAADYLMKDRLARLGSAVEQALARWELKDEKLVSEQTAARLAAMVETSGDAIITKTLDGIITSWNPAAARLYGYSAKDILGKQISILVPCGRRQSDALEDAQDTIERLAKGEPIAAFETVRVRKDGRRIEVLLSISPICDVNGVVTGASAIAHDITQQKRSERLRNAEQAVAGILSESKNLEEAGPRVLQTIAECLRWEVAVLWAVDRHANVLRRQYRWHAPWAEASFIEALSRQEVLGPGVGVAGLTWSTGGPVWEPGIVLDGQPSVTRAGLRGGFGFPMRHDAEMTGVIEFYNPELREPDRSLIVALEIIASQISQFCERRRAEAALRASEEQFRQLANAIPQIVWTARPDGGFDYVNERLFQFAGNAPEADPELTWRSILHPADHQRTLDAWAHSVRNGAPFEIESRIREPVTQRPRWFLLRAVAGTDAAGTVTHWYGTGTDIDDQKKSLDELRISEERYRTLVMALPAAVYTTGPTGRITLFNEHAVKLWGRRPDLDNDRWSGSWKLFQPDGSPLPLDQAPMAVALCECRPLNSKEELGNELIVERPDGSRAHVLQHPKLLRGAAGEIVGAVNMLVDLTQMKRLEEQFLQAQKMEAVGRLAGGVAHDFNNLLTIILGYGELMLQEFKTNERIRDLLQSIVRAGERGAALTRQLLAFSRQQVLRPQVLDLNAILADSENMLRRLIGEDVELHVIKDPDLKNVKADAGQMDQVLLNLAVNARDAMPRGGTLTISTQNVVLTAEQLLGHPENAPGPFVLLTVSDNGCGMDKATQSRIFEPFFTTKGMQGTGLGLATVFGIVKQSQGFIDVISKPGEGAAFRIHIPPAAEPLSSKTFPSSIPGSLGGTENILLAEDDEALRTLTRHLLQALGYSVWEAAGGAEAIAFFEQQGSRIDLLMTDVVMPRMSGRELADELVARRPDIRVLYVSGYTNDAVVHHGVYHDQSHFLQKPFNAAALALKLREVFDTPEHRLIRADVAAQFIPERHR
jgi:PAS domain S-box-containing protein